MNPTLGSNSVISMLVKSLEEMPVWTLETPNSYCLAFVASSRLTSPHLIQPYCSHLRSSALARLDFLRLPTQQRADFISCVLTLIPLQCSSLSNPTVLLTFVESSLPSQTSMECNHKEAACLFHSSLKCSGGSLFPIL